jgi:hypothetical protein
MGIKDHGDGEAMQNGYIAVSREYLVGATDMRIKY